MRRGFTLLELSYVIAVIALLTAITVPAHDMLLRRAKAGEARATLSLIAHAELQHFRDHGVFVACGPSGPVPAEPIVFSDEPCWKELGVRIEATVRYRYSVALDDGSFVVTAEGDLNGDSVPSRFTLDGRTLGLVVEDELE